MRGNLVYGKGDGFDSVYKVRFVEDANGEYEVVEGGRITQRNGIRTLSIDYGEQKESALEKDYVITAFRSRPLQDLWLPHNGDVSKGWSRKGNQTVPYTTEEILDNNLYEIYSVRRESDNEEFTVDELTEQGFIIEFNSTDVPFNVHCSGGYCKLSQLTKKKDKQVLFTTQDNTPVFEGDVHWLDKGTWQTGTALAEDIARNKEVYDGQYFYFSTKEKAEEYILLNKPLLSLNDIKEYIISKYQWDEIVKLVNEKLKQ